MKQEENDKISQKLCAHIDLIFHRNKEKKKRVRLNINVNRHCRTNEDRFASSFSVTETRYMQLLMLMMI